MSTQFNYCQNQIEGHRKCKEQCEHCKEYYAPLEERRSKYKNCNTILEELKRYLDETPREKLIEDCDKLSLQFSNVGPTCEEFIVKLDKILDNNKNTL